jgi:hypothetical protein
MARTTNPDRLNELQTMSTAGRAGASPPVQVRRAGSEVMQGILYYQEHAAQKVGTWGETARSVRPPFHRI